MEVKTHSIQKIEVTSQRGAEFLSSFAFPCFNEKTPVGLCLTSKQNNIHFDGTFYLTQNEAVRLRDSLNEALTTKEAN